MSHANSAHRLTAISAGLPAKTRGPDLPGSTEPESSARRHEVASLSRRYRRLSAPGRKCCLPPRRFQCRFHRSKKNPGGSKPTGASRRSGRLSSQAFRTGYPEKLTSSVRHVRMARAVLQSTSWDAKYRGTNSDVNFFENFFKQGARFEYTRQCILELGTHPSVSLKTGKAKESAQFESIIPASERCRSG